MSNKIIGIIGLISLVIVLIFVYVMYKTAQFANGNTEAQIELRKQMEEDTEKSLQSIRESQQWYQEQ